MFNLDDFEEPELVNWNEARIEDTVWNCDDGPPMKIFKHLPENNNFHKHGAVAPPLIPMVESKGGVCVTHGELGMFRILFFGFINRFGKLISKVRSHGICAFFRSVFRYSVHNVYNNFYIAVYYSRA